MSPICNHERRRPRVCPCAVDVWRFFTRRSRRNGPRKRE
jgi:hypothetical protein